MNINILGVNYKKEEVDIIDDNFEICGQIDYHKQKIKIKKDLGKDIKKVTLLHEIIHGIFENSGQRELNTNEDLINSLANSIYQIFKNNNELIEYLK